MRWHGHPTSVRTLSKCHCFNVLLQRDTSNAMLITLLNLNCGEEKRIFKNQRHLLGTRNSSPAAPEDTPNTTVTPVSSPTSQAVMTFTFRLFSQGGHLCSAHLTVTGIKKKKKKGSEMLRAQRTLDGSYELNLDPSLPSST